MLALNDVQIPPPKSWEKLEALIWDLLRAEWNDFHAQRNGRRGQSQKGVDVFGRPDSGTGWTGVQCKNKDLLLRATLTVKELRQEVHNAKSFKPPLKKFIVATTAARDVRIQEEARKITDRHLKAGLFSVHVYAWDDVQDLIAKHDTIAKQYYGHLLPGRNDRAPLLSDNAIQAAFAAPASSRTREPTQEIPVQVLSAPAAQALGILATSPVPFARDSYQKLFTAVDWTVIFPELLAAKAVSERDALIVVNDAVKTRFLPTDAARNEYLNVWIAALSPLAHHVDMALFLALQCVARGEPIQAVEVITSLAGGLERGIWNNQYAVFLGAFDKPDFYRRLTPNQRLEYLSAYGGCLARADKPVEAKKCAGRLLAASKSAKDRAGEAQALLLFGLAHQYLGEVDKAAAYYERTVAHAAKHGVDRLVGHAMHNLAMLKIQTEPEEAKRLLDHSIEAKKRVGDHAGRVGTLFGRGSLAASQGEFATAFRWYARAEKQAAKMDMQHARALSLCNMGTSLADQGKPRAALKHFRTAETLADQEGYPDALALAVGGAAMAYLAVGQFVKAEERFRYLQEVHRDAGDIEAEVTAHHDVGVCLLKQGKGDEARKVLSSTYDDAVKHNLSEWIYRCAKDIALTRLELGSHDEAITVLREAAARETTARRHGVSARLWESMASVLAEHAPSSPEIERAFRNALAESVLAGQLPEAQFRLIGGLHQHLWDSGRGLDALEVLRTGISRATDAKHAEYQCRFKDQVGTCLQQLGDYKAAVSEHRAALRMARSLQDKGLLENCLNNLGEALRKTGQSTEAVRLFTEAEALARSRGDEESEISVAHNRALALEDLGQRVQAAAVLRRCRDVARRLEFWDQYVRALHGLANHAWLTSKAQQAEGLYREAFAAAKKHRMPEQRVMVAISYANALRVRGQPMKACRVLLGVRDAASGAPDAWDYNFALAAAASEAGETSVAIAAYEAAARAAQVAGAMKEAIEGTVALAESLAEAGQFDRAGDVISTALSSETEGPRRVSLLTARLKLLLRTGNRREAGRVFKQVQRLAKNEGMKEELVDLHMFLGDHYWEGGKSRLEALKAYIAALPPACDISVEVMIETGAYVIRRLLDQSEGPQAEWIETLHAKLKVWLAGQITKKQYAAAERVIFWPMRVALLVARSGQDFSSLPDETWTEYVTKELLGQPKKSSTTLAR